MADKEQARADIKEFLTTRRARITPEQAGLRTYGGSRRVKGLRREEVATLSGISAEYYTRLERGNVAGASESVLDGIANALQLTDDERAHLLDLVRAAASSRPAQRRRPPQVRVRPSVQRILDSLTLAPAFVVDARLDILAANELGRALYAPIFEDPIQPPNHARFLFLDRRAGDFWRDWAQAADDAVALLRASAGRDPYDRPLSDLIGALSTRIEPGVVATELPNHITHNETRRGVQQLYDQAEVTADDVAEVIAFTLSRPRHLAINEVLLRPAGQL